MKNCELKKIIGYSEISNKKILKKSKVIVFFNLVVLFFFGNE